MWSNLVPLYLVVAGISCTITAGRIRAFLDYEGENWDMLAGNEKLLLMGEVATATALWWFYWPAIWYLNWSLNRPRVWVEY